MINQAALLNVGCGPFVGLIITIVIVGVIVWAVKKFGGLLTFVDEWYRKLAITLVFWAGVIYICLLLLDFVFGLNFLNVHPLACG